MERSQLKTLEHGLPGGNPGASLHGFFFKVIKNPSTNHLVFTCISSHNLLWLSQLLDTTEPHHICILSVLI